MNKSTLGVEEVKFVVEATPRGRDSRRVRQHAHATRHLGEVAARDVSGWFITDTELEAGGAPIHELNGSPGLDDTNSRVDVLGNDITAVEQCTGHCNRLDK